MDHWLRSRENSKRASFLAVLFALALCAQVTPSQSQLPAAQPGAPSSQPVGQAPATQPAPQQPPTQMPQVSVPLAEFSQYAKFLIDQTTMFADFTKQQLEFIRQQTAANSERTTEITKFLKEETNEFKTFVVQAVGGIVVVASIIAAVMAFFGIRRWKDLINEQRVLVTNLMTEQRQAAESIISGQRQAIRSRIRVSRN